MSESSIVTRLPIAVREELDRRLAARDFKDLQEGLEWLGRQGYRFARGAFIRYRKGFYRRAEAETIAVAQVRAIAEEGGGDVIMAERLARLVRHRLFGALLELSEPIPARDLMGIAKAVAEDSRMSVRRHRWEAAMEERLEDQRRAMAAAVATMAEAGELSLAAADAVRALLRGIDPLGARAGSARRSPAR